MRWTMTQQCPGLVAGRGISLGRMAAEHDRHTSETVDSRCFTAAGAD